MSKHTPGPWKIDGESDRVIVAHDGETLAQTYFVYGDRDRQYPQSIANARLIAAAPDLLEACRFALSIIGHPDDAGTNAIADAIAKAEGLAPESTNSSAAPHPEPLASSEVDRDEDGLVSGAGQ